MSQTMNKQLNNTTAFDVSDALNSVVPGFPFFSKVFAQMGIDVSSYVVGLMAFAAVAAALQYCSNTFNISLYAHTVSTIEIRMQDEAYNYLMLWISKQDFTKKSHRIVASTRLTSDQISWDGRDEDDSDGETAENVKAANDDQTSEDDDSVQDQPLNYIKSARKRRSSAKPLHWSPSPGTHFFRYDKRIMWFTRTPDERHTVSYSSRPENISISSLGRDAAPLKKLMREAQDLFLDNDSGKTVIYRASKKLGYDDLSWVRSMARVPRPLETVVLSETKKFEILDDITEYLHPSTKRWYGNRGIPYRRGYLFHGPPGTGKTSLASALAGVFGLKLYAVNLSSPNLSDDNLAGLFQSLPRTCIVLLEDIDATGITDTRSKSPVESDTVLLSKPAVSSDPTNPNLQEDGSKPAGDGNQKELSPVLNRVSLSGLLNVLDGIASQEGRILIMTTNHIDKIDSALVRPGRVDLSIGFVYADSVTIREIFLRIYTVLPADGMKPTTFGWNRRNEKLEGPNSYNTPLRSPQNSTQKSQSVVQSSSDDKKESAEDWSTDIQVLADRFSEIIPPNRFTPAEIQGYLLLHKYRPEKAVHGAKSWIERSVR